MIAWRRIYEYPFRHQSHVFVDGRGMCPAARRHAHKMTPTKAPTSALDTCPACARWLRMNRRAA